MKYAYLIIAHNEFQVLQRLVSALDDGINDIYIHYDKKVKKKPDIRVKKAGLYIVEKRVDVRWGSISQIKCEYRIWEEAFKNGPYKHYVLISGTHYPLMTQAEIMNTLADWEGKNVIQAFGKEIAYQEDMKVHKFNFFMTGYASRRKIVQSCSQFMWKACLAVQKKVGLRRNSAVAFYRGSNWTILSEAGIEHMLSVKKDALSIFKYTFCADEYLVPTMLMASELRSTIINTRCLLFQDMLRANARVLGAQDIENMKNSDCMFARKFSDENIDVLDSINSL